MSFIDKQKEKIETSISTFKILYNEHTDFVVIGIIKEAVAQEIQTNKEWCDEVVKSNLHYAIIEKLKDFKQWLEEKEKGL